MSKYFGSSILADGATVERFNLAGVSDTAPAKPHPVARRLGKFRPFGLESAPDVYQIVGEGVVGDDVLAGYEKALQSFEAGDWTSAKQLLDSLPSEDVAVGFLTDYITHQVSPASEFRGVIRMSAK